MYKFAILTKDTADKTSNDLKHKRGTRRYVILLCQPEIFRKEFRLLRSVVRKACEVEVGQWMSWEKVASQHLTDRLYVVLESSDAHLRTEEESEDEGKTQGKEVPPPWQCGLQIVSVIFQCDRV
jgi:hypothetical protein